MESTNTVKKIKRGNTNNKNKRTCMKTTIIQWKKFLDLMTESPEMAGGKPNVGLNREFIKQKWRYFASELNCLGPPCRTGEQWNRVWLKYKGSLKRKHAIENTILQANDGDHQNSLDLISPEQEANPLGFDFGRTNAFQPAENNEIQNTAPETTFSQGRIENQAPETTPQREEAKTQLHILETLKTMESTLRKGYEIKKKLHELRRETAAEKSELRRLNIEIGKLNLEKLQLEMQRFTYLNM